MTLPDEALQKALRALPPLDPPADGWSALQRTLRPTPQRRYRRGAAGLALAASLLMGLGMALRLPTTSPRPASVEDGELAALMRQSRSLEQHLARLRPQVDVWNAGYEAAAQTLEGRLAVVDMQLNYAAPASARRLWQDRVALLGSLVETHQAASLQFAPPNTLPPNWSQPDNQMEWSL